MSSTILKENFYAAVQNKDIPGAILVATNKTGTLEFAETFGKGGVSPTAKPLTLDSTFWIASCTKLMTTIAALQCVERGLFSLDSPDDVAHLLPEYSGPEIVTGLDEYGKSMMKPATKRMTLRHLLTQSSGLGFSISSPSIQAWSAEHGKEMFPADIADGLRLPLLFEPGEGFEYGVGLDWVGKMVERANDGIGLEEYMRGQIWSPLGMGKTTFHLEQREDVARDLVEMTSRSSSDGTLTKAVSHMPTPVKEASGGGGAYTTPKDFVNILSSLLRDDGRLLRSESIEEMFRPQLSSTIIDAWMAKESGIVRWKDASRIHTGKEDSKLNWGLGSMLILEDLDNGLRKGTLTWGGSPNMFWWVDRDAGVCGIYASQIVPPGDAKSSEMFRLFQTDIYKQVAALENQ